MSLIINNSSIKNNTTNDKLSQAEGKVTLKPVKASTTKTSALEPALASKPFYVTSTISDGFSPTPIYAKHETSSPSEYNLDLMLKNMSNIALTLLPLMKAQGKSLQAMATIQNNMLELMDSFSKMLHDLADARVKTMDKEYQDALKKIEEQTRDTGFWGMLFGGLEAIIGIVTMAVAGEFGVGMIIGGALLADGLTKFISSAMAAADPKLVEDNPWIKNFMQDGMFGGFDFIQEGAGQKAQMLFAMLTLVVSGGESVSSVVGGIIQGGIRGAVTAGFSLLLAANLAFMAYGYINGFIKDIQADSSDEVDTNKKNIDGSQVMGMGFASWLLYKTLEDWTDASKDLKDETSEGWQMGIEMAAYFALSMGTNIGLNAGMRSVEMPTNIQKMQAQMASISNYLNLENSVTQASTASYNVNAAALNKIQVEQSSSIQFEGTILTLLKDMVNRRITEKQDQTSQLGKDMQGIANAVDNFKQQLSQIMQNEINFNAQYMGG